MVTSQRRNQTEEHISISEEDLSILVATRNGAAYVVDLLSRSARPGRGAAPLLRAFGAMARVAVEATVRRSSGRPHWFSGALSIDVISSGAGITVDVMTDHDATRSPREALFERTYFAIPFEELRWMVDRIPELAGPLRLRSNAGRGAAPQSTTPDARSGGFFSAMLTLHVPPSPQRERMTEDLICADDTAKIIVSPESLFDPDSTSPVPALMAEMAHLSLPSHVDPREL